LLIVSDTTELGYTYLKDLCIAIAAYTEEIVASNSTAFRYRGADLRFVLERHLYFLCLECEPLFHAYMMAKSGEPLPIVYFPSNEQVGVARRLHPKINAVITKEKFSLRFVAKRMGLISVRNALRNLFKSKTSYEPLHPAACGEFPQILFHVIDVKFARYFELIAKSLPFSYSYLLAVDDRLSEPMARLGIPCLDLSPNRFRPATDWDESVRSEKDSLEGLAWLTSQFDQVYEALAFSKPRCVVVAEGNAPLDALTSEACRLLSIPIICIQQGWAPFVHNGFRNMSFTKMLVWGKGFAELLQPYNPCQKFVAVGNHVLQHLAVTMHEKSEKKIAGVSFFVQSPCVLLSESRFFEFLNLIEWTAITFPSTPVLVRAHPNYPLPDEFEQRFARCKNIRLMHPKTHQLADVLAASRVAVAVFSSTILEAISVGVLPIVCNLSSLPRYSPDIDKASAGIEVHGISETKEALHRVIENEAYCCFAGRGMSEFRSIFFESGNAAQRICDEIVANCKPV